MSLHIMKMKGAVAAGAQVLLCLPFVLTLSLSSEITFSSHWSESPVCEGFTLEMTCIVHLTNGFNTVSKVTVIKDRGKDSNMYCNVWPIPDRGEAICGSSTNEGTMSLMVNGTMVGHTFIILIVLPSVQENDGGGYECSVGTDNTGTLGKVSTTTLTLDVRERSQCTNLPEIPFSRSLVVNSTNTPMCIFSVMPSSVHLWMTDNKYVSNNMTHSIKSGDYIATWVNTEQLKSDNNVYTCELKLNKARNDVIDLHTFQRPTIKFYPTNNCSHDYLFCVEVWVISSSSLLSPITCTVNNDFEVRYVGSRSAVVSSCNELDEFQHLSNSSILCEASNQFGHSENILNVSSITNYVTETEDPGMEPSVTEQTILSYFRDTTVVTQTLPGLFQSVHGMILFSILIVLVIVVVICVSICGWKLKTDYKTRLSQRMKDSSYKDTYWSFLPKESKNSVNLKERALPHRPDSVYASCEADLSVAMPPEEAIKCPAKPPPPLGQFGRNTGQTQDNVKCQICSCSKKLTTSISPPYTRHDKIELVTSQEKYLTKEDFQSGYIVPLAGKKERDVTFYSYDIPSYSKLLGIRRPGVTTRRTHSALYDNPTEATSTEELNRNRKFSF